MAGKDFRENAPLDAAKERQGFVAAKIRELESEVSNAQILSGEAQANAGKRVVVGSNITIKDVSSGKRITYILVDKREADVASGKISTVSPVGQALLDRSVGDTVDITVPKGTLSYTIEKIGSLTPFRGGPPPGGKGQPSHWQIAEDQQGASITSPPVHFPPCG